MRSKKSTATNEWILLKNGESAVELKFSQEPKQREGSSIYYFYFNYKDAVSGKRHYSRVSTDEKDFRRAKDNRDRLYDKIHAELNAEEVRQSDKQPIGDFFDLFLQVKEQEGKTKKTLYDYRYAIMSFVKYTDAQLPLSNVSADLLRKFLYRIDSDSLRSGTFRVLRAAFNFAIQEEKLEKNPLDRIKLKKQSEPIRDYFRESEKDFFKLYERFPESSYVEKTAKNAALLSYAIGLRLGEVCHIRIKLKDINWSRKELTISNTEEFHTKNSCERVLPITPRVEQALKDQFTNKATHFKEIVRESTYLFANEAGRPYSNEKNKSSKLSRIFAKVRNDIFPDRKGLHFHSLRHSFGQNAYNDGMPIVEISKMMGHKNVSVTMRYYAKQSDYKNLTTIHNYLNKQGAISSHDKVDSPITGSINELELTECVHSD